MRRRPTAVSMLLAGVLVPMAGYGILRVAYPIFPEQAADAWFYVGLIAVVTILYAALMALAQKDVKRLVSCVSLAGMGYVLLGLAVMTPIATAGALFQMVSVALASALMFFVVGILDDRAHHREIRRLGGLWTQMPAFTGWAALVGFLALMGLPGLCGFVGQLLVLLGVFSAADTGSFLMRHSSGTAFIALLWFGVLGAAAASGDGGGGAVDVPAGVHGGAQAGASSLRGSDEFGEMDPGDSGDGVHSGGGFSGGWSSIMCGRRLMG